MCNVGEGCFSLITQYKLIQLECSHVVCGRCVRYKWSDPRVICCPLCYLPSTKNLTCHPVAMRGYLKQYGRSSRTFSGCTQRIKGLPSIDNSCFINVVIQVLAQTPNFFRSLFHVNTLSSSLIESLINVISDINNIDTADEPFHRADDLRRIRHVVSKKDPTFGDFSPNDSHAFFLSLLEMLQSDTVSGPTYLFQGNLCHSLRCAGCSYIHTDRTDEQPFFYLNIPATGDTVSLPEGLLMMTEQACYTDQRICPQCSNNSEVVKVMEIRRYPDILVLHVSKYYMVENDGQWSAQRLHNNVIISSSLSVKVRSTSDIYLKNVQEERKKDAQNDICKFSLYGIISHDGPINEGHYTAHVRKLYHESSKAEWHYCDDMNVTNVSVEEEIHLNNAYMIFYCKGNALAV